MGWEAVVGCLGTWVPACAGTTVFKLTTRLTEIFTINLKTVIPAKAGIQVT